MSAQNWNLLLCGINHKTASVEEREPLQLSHQELSDANTLLFSIDGVTEALVVSTCNRVEFYLVVTNSYSAFDLVCKFYQQYRQLDISELQEKFYTRKGRHVASHLFRVVAGIDSMILGENQIVGQLREAYSIACHVKSAGKLIHRMFHQAFRTGKQARSLTELGKGACSVSTAAVGLLRSKLDRQDRPRILFVGVSEMIKLAASGLFKLHYDKFFFANRTPAHVEALAATYSSTGHSLEEISDLLSAVDIVISCTGSDEPVVSDVHIKSLLKVYPDKKLLMIDMAIPRDIVIEGSYGDNLRIYNLEDIKEFAETQQLRRSDEIPAVEEIVEKRLAEFVYWYNHLRNEALFNGLSDSFEAIRELELSAILEKLEPELRAEVDYMSRRLVNRLLKITMRSSQQSRQER